MRQVAMFLAVSLATVCALYLADSGEATPRWISATVQDREFCINRLNTLSDWVGFEAHFFPEGPEARTLVMTGSDLCGPGFIRLLPKIAYDDIMASGFNQARCVDNDGGEFIFLIHLEDYR